LLDQKNLQLTGISTAGQPRLIGELKISLEAEVSLVSAALLNGVPYDSFQPPQPLTVTDHLLLRLCKGLGMSCHPLHFEGRGQGVVVLGVDSVAGLERLQSLQLKMFSQVVSAAMVRVSVEAQEHFDDGTNLLRRVSHEVSNPLTIIGNYAGVLNHLIPEFPEHSIDLHQLVRDIADSLGDVEFKPRKIIPKFDLQSTLDKMVTNPVLVKQILINLLKNAAEAVDEGGLIQIVTRDGYSADRGRHVEIIVQDNGSGIAPQLQEKLFKPVVSSKGAGHAGVGLSIVKGMVDDLGGWISYHSSVESGTSFHLQLPCGDDRPVNSRSICAK